MSHDLADSALLGDKNQDMSLEEFNQFTEVKEAGKQSAGHLSQSQGVDATQPIPSCQTGQDLTPQAWRKQ